MVLVFCVRYFDHREKEVSSERRAPTKQSTSGSAVRYASAAVVLHAIALLRSLWCSQGRIVLTYGVGIFTQVPLIMQSLALAGARVRLPAARVRQGC